MKKFINLQKSKKTNIENEFIEIKNLIKKSKEARKISTAKSLRKTNIGWGNVDNKILSLKPKLNKI